jgi:hypothetical protein
MNHPYILTSETIVIEPNHDKSVVILPDPRFRPRQILIPHEAANNFFVTEIKFGRRSQLLSTGAVHASLFSNNAAPEDFDFEPLKEDEDIKISATNISDKPTPFSVSLVGDRWDRNLRHEQKTTQLVRNFIGFGSTNLQPGSSANISVQPQLPFHGERLIIPSSLADNFAVSSIKCGHNEQMVISSPVPAMLFSEQNPQIGMRGLALDVVHTSMLLTIQIVNTSNNIRNFSCSFVGTFDLL